MTIFHPAMSNTKSRRWRKHLRDADCIFFMGMGASGAIAQYVARKAQQISATSASASMN